MIERLAYMMTEQMEEENTHYAIAVDSSEAGSLTLGQVNDAQDQGSEKEQYGCRT